MYFTCCSPLLQPVGQILLVLFRHDSGGGVGRGLVPGVLNTASACSSIMTCFPLQHPILLRLFPPLVARVKRVQVPFLPLPRVAEGQFLSKKLKPRNLAEMSGESATCGSF